MSWLSRFLRERRCSLHRLVPHSPPLLVLHFAEPKSLEVFRADATEPVLVCRLKPRKKIRAFWANPTTLFALDKFGDVWAAALDRLAQAPPEPRFEDLFELQTSVFSDTIDFFESRDGQLLVQSDDYYRLRVLSRANPQRLLAVHALRPYFACKVWEQGGLVGILFDDFKVLALPWKDFLRPDYVLDETQLFGVEGAVRDRFFDVWRMRGEGELIGVYWDREAETGEGGAKDGVARTGEALRLTIDLAHRKAQVTERAAVKGDEAEFLLVDDGRVYAGEGEVFKN